MPLRFDAKTQRWITEFSRYIKRADGTNERVRKVKTFPAGTTEEQAKFLAAQHESEQFVKAHLLDNENGWRLYVQGMYANPRSWIYIATAKARTRAKQYRRDCTVTPEIVRDLLLESGGRCAVTGMKFDLSACSTGRARPFFHSLDRTDSSKGYTHGNTRIVCFAVNVAMLHWGETVFDDLATGYILRKYALAKALLS